MRHAIGFTNQVSAIIGALPETHILGTIWGSSVAGHSCGTAREPGGYDGLQPNTNGHGLQPTRETEEHESLKDLPVDQGAFFFLFSDHYCSVFPSKFNGMGRPATETN